MRCFKHKITMSKNVIVIQNQILTLTLTQILTLIQCQVLTLALTLTDYLWNWSSLFSLIRIYILLTEDSHNRINSNTGYASLMYVFFWYFIILKVCFNHNIKISYLGFYVLFIIADMLCNLMLNVSLLLSQISLYLSNI